MNPKYQFINATRNLITTSVERDVIIDDIFLKVNPSVFDPSIFFSSRWFAKEIATLVSGESIFIEVGCGTGIVSIRVAQENPQLMVYATDVNTQAAELTQVNAERNNVSSQIQSYSGDVLDAIPDSIKADSIFWAMPFGYLQPTDTLTQYDTQVFDPGYRAIRKFFETAQKYLSESGRLLIGFSVDIGHFELLKEIAEANNFTLRLLKQKKGTEEVEVSMEIWEAVDVGS